MSVIFNGIIGLVCGILSAYGIGGGSLLVLYISLFTGISTDEIRSINLLYFIFTAPIAIFIHKQSDFIDKPTQKRVTLFGLFASVIGVLLSNTLENRIFIKIYGYFLLILGCFELFRRNPNANLHL